MNQSIFVGNLAADPELSYGAQGVAMALFTVMNTERFRDDKGNWKDAAPVAVRCVAYGKIAEHITESLRKGNRVLVAATYTQRTVEKNGEKRTYNSFKVDYIGPDLTFNTVTVPGNSTGKPAPQQQGANEDPWALGN